MEAWVIRILAPRLEEVCEQIRPRGGGDIDIKHVVINGFMRWVVGWICWHGRASKRL